MAEEQEKQKPKATLIKQRKAETPETHEKKKVRVVLKRKPKAKVVVKKHTPESVEKDESKTTPAPEVVQASIPEPKSKPVEPVVEPESKRVESKPPKKEVPKKEAKSPEPKKKELPQSEMEQREARITGFNRSKPRTAAGDPAAIERMMKTNRDGRRGSGTRTSPGRPEGRSGTRPQPGTRSTADRDPSTGSGRGGTQRSGAPRSGGPRGTAQRPSSPRSGGGTSGGARPTPPPASTGGRKQPGKKFYKSKRGREFTKEERLQEKELAVTRKKSKVKTNPVPKEIDIMEVITVSELAKKMNLKAGELIGKLMGMGVMVTINQQIDAETAQILAEEYGCTVNIVSLYDETVIETEEDSEESKEARPPIVTIMGHVDHGKTKLLDAIRSTDVVGDEYGGITQHIGAYQVKLDQGKITFLDTPGHEAFTLMRARGAQITDIVVLVVAATDGVMPQTIEAVNHAKDANVPIIVAINKIDLADANPDRVKQQLSDYELMPEDWGGNTMFVEVSALKKEGIDNLLESILLQAEILELNAAYDRNAEGKVIESRIDPGRGTVATVLIERGTLSVGDSFVAGIYPGKVRAMFDDHGRKVTKATPSMPVEIIGFDGVPKAGDPFQVTDTEKQARQIGGKRQELKRVEEAQSVKKITLENIYESIQDGQVQELKVVIKGDVHGSVEALKIALERMSTPEVRLVAIHSSAGAINERDVMLAAASNALVVGFHVRPTPRAQAVADQEKVEIRKYNIIYDAVADIRSAMEGMLAPDLQEEVIGTVEVRDTFKVPKIGVIAGCYVQTGNVTRSANIRVFRDSVQVYEGKISSLRRFKDDARQVDAGYECGIGIESFQDLQVGDEFEIFVIKEVAKKLTD